MRLSEPSRLVLAAPVTLRSVISELEPECDKIIFLATPEHFYAVGSLHTDFSQTSDQEVIDLFGKARNLEVDSAESRSDGSEIGDLHSPKGLCFAQ